MSKIDTSLQETDLQEADNQKLPNSERFTNTVLKEFGGTVDAPQVTDYQRQLIQGYFIGVDRALKSAEETRVRKNKSNSDAKYNNDLPFIWKNVNLNALALDLVHFARMGLDMMQDNHLFPIPYKNNNTNQYDITLMKGYNGIQYIAQKYAVDPPLDVTIELVYDTDEFTPVKKSKDNEVEGYQFEINQPFDRGKIVGGFGYIEYTDPVKNKLVLMSIEDILKRKPKHAPAEFWGGKKTVWENGKKVEAETDGWYEEMCRKTIIREVYNAKHIPRDPKKVDDSYQHMKMQETRYAELEAQAEIDEQANTIFIDTSEEDTTTPENINIETGEVSETEQPSLAAKALPLAQAAPDF